MRFNGQEFGQAFFAINDLHIYLLIFLLIDIH